ncbi:uncharacterized protein (DUF1501 family) [Aeromicrobium sp. SORGH_AS981]|uniref:DUF1501 domain-containing protein n=1 Tax=Aeromicrobium sp. SORGH_AS_0981 TaxID=3041802 RepID=UPI0028658AF5|nr:DUF1501 domain-containing protein [Aeromicrobium sp. SORGH_AS_0981]MDR6117095.1 uncharacterized protein (DUF1501 family) [Aeromicrobium sp. SORGH_AS_0981]
MTGTDDCGCVDYGLTRRSLLASGAALGLGGVVTSMVGDVLTSAVYGATGGNVLVVLSLRGGADGLSMVVPHAEAAYHAARPTTALKATELLHADATFGLHPKFAPLSRWWQAGSLAAVHAVGLPAPNRSHFEAMEELEDADPGSSARVGWINRMITGLGTQPDVLDAMQLGSTTMPTSLLGPAPAVATETVDDLGLPFADDARLSGALGSFLQTTYGRRGGVVGSAGLDAYTLSRRTRSIADAARRPPANGARYASGDTGRAMTHAAGLVTSGLGVRAIAIDAGGWDHHIGLRWNVAARIEELATNLAAFFTDLGPAADRVTLVTMSEFGRRLRENGANGVDHGYGSCALLMGAGVRGGRVHARWPGLGTEQQVDGDLAVTTDYRDVVAEVLRSRFPEVDVSAVFPGLVQRPLGIMA